MPDKHIPFIEELEFRDRVRSCCSCGWRASGLDSTRRGAGQAWAAHMYAMGFKTSEAIQEASQPEEEQS